MLSSVLRKMAIASRDSARLDSDMLIWAPACVGGDQRRASVAPNLQYPRSTQFKFLMNAMVRL